MKILLLIGLLLCMACDPQSSPEGRMSLKLDAIAHKLDSLDNYRHLQQQIDSLKYQQATLLDSLIKINLELKEVKKK